MSDAKAIIAEADAVLARPDIAGCHAILTKAYADGVTDPQLLWRLGRSYYEMSQETTDKAVRDEYVTKGLQVAQKALEADANIGAAHKWVGILLSAQPVGTKERIANAYVIRDHFLKAIELCPEDANSLHCMGNWCYSVLQISWLERKAAALLFGEPPSSSYEECLKYLLAAAKIENTIHNACLIGDAYYQQSKYDEAKEWYQKALDMPAHSELQKRHQAEAREKIQNC